MYVSDPGAFLTERPRESSRTFSRWPRLVDSFDLERPTVHSARRENR